MLVKTGSNGVTRLDNAIEIFIQLREFRQLFLFSLKTAPNMALTTGPAKNICQQSAIGKFLTVVSIHTATNSLPAFLKSKVAARLISGHINITDTKDMASTR